MALLSKTLKGDGLKWLAGFFKKKAIPKIPISMTLYAGCLWPRKAQSVSLHSGELMLIRTFLTAILLFPVLCAATVDSQRGFVTSKSTKMQLPELPAGGAEGRWGIDISEDGVGLGFKNGKERWEAHVGNTIDGLSSIHVEHIELVTDRLGFGSSMKHELGNTALILNSVYAPWKDTRFRFAAAQTIEDEASGESPSSSQRSVLIGAKKSWRRGTLSEVAIRLYGTEVQQRLSAPSILHNSASYSDGDSLHDTTYSRLYGASFSYGMRAIADGALKLRFETNQSSRYGIGPQMGNYRSNILRIEYAQTLRNCMVLTSHIASTKESNAIDITLSRQHWRVQASQTIGGESSTTVMFAFVQALGTKGASTAKCRRLEPEPLLEPILEAAGNSPEQLLYDPRVSGM